MEYFYTGEESSVASIDTSFILGLFSVTPITYHNLLVKTTRNGNHPIMVGPVLVYQTKTLKPFHYFGSTLIQLNPKLSWLKAYSTDGEPESFKRVLPKGNSFKMHQSHASDHKGEVMRT